MHAYSIAFVRLAALAALMSAQAAHAISFDLDADGDWKGVLNTTMTAGAAWRMQSPSSQLIGKSNLDPSLCAHQYQSCQGLFLTQTYPATHIAASPGMLSMNADDGNLNYAKHDLFSGIAKITQDLTLTLGDFGIFAKWLYFYDFVNNDFTEYHPNRITSENVNAAGFRNDPISNRYFDHTFGPGSVVENPRNDGEILRQVGADLQLLDLNFYGRVTLPGDRELSFKIGRQAVNWGESTLLAINSLNQANPVNANNLYRIGTQVEELFTPVNMVSLSTEPFLNSTVEVFYQLEWKPVEAPAPGSYFSYSDLGTNNAVMNANVSFGGAAEDPEGLGTFQDNPLALITDTTSTIRRIRDNTPDASGQYGIAFKYYAEDLNNGTEFGLYFMNYHSRLPYVSFYASQPSCARREGNSQGIDARNTIEFLQTCSNLPAVAISSARQQLTADAVNLILNNPQVIGDLGVVGSLLGDPVGALGVLQGLLLGGDPNAPLSDAVPLDTAMIQFEYPENIQLFGLSFNTPVGEYALQGEVAYRPHQPLQIALADLSFAAYGPTLTRCHDPNLGCAGSSAGSGFQEDGTHSADNGIYYGGSDVADTDPAFSYNDTINILLGDAPGSARAFPNFVIPYRGGIVGENAATDLSKPLNSKNPGYIRGWEYFSTYEFNLGFTRVYGASDNPFGADQIQLVGELGAIWTPGLPSLDQLQIESPGVYTSASAGADGTGADGSRQACSTNPTCVVGPDGLRFNPTQANLDAYVDKLAWGYRVITTLKYESVYGPISVQPFIIWAHDVSGTGPGPAENFVEGRKQAYLTIETRYKSALSFTVGYAWFFGGGANNLYSDRDFAQALVKYQF
ncbi:DUF1302 domain-containing protein [Sinimarinibacterium sp. CAU 1509]|uniref:DUF1302 domain-containing protein n=1 Tax=Sinimarinibacterium sp. CAU 1509 TaxID=2562283 RepID=UPI0010AC392F|nr:DUF1302 family protein [Sinimarinibacterium sp. CAU 1509]TJY61012.1 DUF1302 domain-containing protein [Sinimarinibacterium sp. CAU 1509]